VLRELWGWLIEMYHLLGGVMINIMTHFGAEKPHKSVMEVAHPLIDCLNMRCWERI